MGKYSIRKYKTKRRTKDLDLIHDDLSSVHTIENLKHQGFDEDKPGMGQYYCIHCARYFQDNKALKQHLKTKVHKRRVKQLNANPYTTLEAEAATGLNLERFINKVQEYHNTEPERQKMEKQLLVSQTDENDVKDQERHAQLYPEEAESKKAVSTDAMATD